jgi:predicted ATP-grasp superfamily ATP-dependent carboligase
MNKVIVVGGNHHNGLGLARALGINGVEVHAVVIDDTQDSFLSKSKFIKSCVVYKDEKTALDYIMATYSFEKERAFIIPYSDRAAEELDSRLNQFIDYFYVPSINQKQGMIVELMDKERQYNFAEHNGIKMAKTTVVYIDEEATVPIDFPMPCILKPVVSAEGDKKDITVCDSRQELANNINKYASLGYQRVLLQEYLNIDYEIDVFGCILRYSPYFCIVPTHTIRSWPSKGGTNSFSYIITDKSIVEKCKKVIKGLCSYGFYGLYDIELFVVNGEIYLNEMNLRNSGDVYMALKQNYYYPLAWYNDVLNIRNTISVNPTKGNYCMTECSDLRHVVFENYSFFQWLRDYKKCKDYALKFKGDMKPAYTRYMYYLKKVLFHK